MILHLLHIQVKLFFAKQFSVRERGLQTAKEALAALTSRSRVETGVWVRGTAELLGRALKDDVFSVRTVCSCIMHVHADVYTICMCTCTCT